jgi:hypothetical protein
VPQFNQQVTPPPPTGLSWVDALARAIQPPTAMDWSSAVSPGLGVVTTPAAVGAQALKAGAPKVYQALERAPFSFSFGTEKLPGAAGIFRMGYGTGYGPSTPLSTSLGLPIQRVGKILTRPHLAKDLETLLHEALHALYYAKNKGTTPTYKAGKQVVEKMAPNLGPIQRMLYNHIYETDPAHGAVELMAKNIMQRLKQKPPVPYGQ